VHALDLPGATGMPLVKVFAWYDNEWGYAARLVGVGPWRTLRAMAEGTHLAVLPSESRTTLVALRVLLDAGSCPVVVVPPD